MKSTALVVALAGAALGGLIAPAHADPLNPRDPDYCGNSPDILVCTQRLSTYPNAGESAFLTDIRGLFPPSSEAPRLAAGRAICLELPGHATSSITRQTEVYLRTSPQVAGRVVDSAHTNICPRVQPQG